MRISSVFASSSCLPDFQHLLGDSAVWSLKWHQESISNPFCSFLLVNWFNTEPNQDSGVLIRRVFDGAENVEVLVWARTVYGIINNVFQAQKQLSGLPVSSFPTSHFPALLWWRSGALKISCLEFLVLKIFFIIYIKKQFLLNKQASFLCKIREHRRLNNNELFYFLFFLFLSEN